MFIKFSPIFLLILVSCSHNRDNKSPYTGIDCHMHVHPRGEGLYKASRVRTALDSVGLSHGCILSQGYQGPYGKEKGKFKSLREFTTSRNDWTLSESKKYKGLLPFCSVPVKASWASEEVKRCIKNGNIGLKLHLASENAFLNKKRIRTNLESIFAATSDKLIVLIHINHDNKNEIKSFFDILKKYPETKVIVAHNMGKNVSMLKDAPKNLYVEISSLVMWPQESGSFFVTNWRRFGIDRVILGSDWPVFHPAEHLYFLEKYPLTDKERNMIVRNNAKTLFQKYIK